MKTLLTALVLTVLLTGSVFAQSYGPCNDGTESSSIGAQGACSHHGGVDRDQPLY